MLENSVWRQYHKTLDIYPILKNVYASWEEMEISTDELFLHNRLKDLSTFK